MPMTASATKPATFTERNNWLRARLAGRIEVLVPSDDPETERLYTEEKADHD